MNYKSVVTNWVAVLAYLFSVCFLTWCDSLYNGCSCVIKLRPCDHISAHIFCICQLLVLWFDGQNNMASIVIMYTVPQVGISPVYVASQEGHTDVVDILLRSGADVHQTTKVCHYNN